MFTPLMGCWYGRKTKFTLVGLPVCGWIATIPGQMAKAFVPAVAVNFDVRRKTSSETCPNVWVTDCETFATSEKKCDLAANRLVGLLVSFGIVYRMIKNRKKKTLFL